jgi:hypothetical protein
LGRSPQNFQFAGGACSCSRLGVINIRGVQQQYGKNFGVSAVPFRPRAIYNSPIGRR